MQEKVRFDSACQLLQYQNQELYKNQQLHQDRK